jgi:hypothetical protein
MTERRLRQQAPAARGATVEPGHLGAGADLVDKNQLVGIDEGLRRPPDAAPGSDVRAVLLGSAQRLMGWPAPLSSSISCGDQWEREGSNANLGVRDRPGQE